MKIFRKYYFPDICISFTLVIICSSIWNIATSNDPIIYHRFILELVGTISLLTMIAYLLNKIEFKKWVHFWILQGIINYTVSFTAGYFLNWFGFRILNIVVFTSIFFIAYLAIVFYTYQNQKQEEELINRLIEQRNTRS